MSPIRPIKSTPDARILCISNRLIEPVISRCLRHEFEDVVASVDRVDVLGPEAPTIRSRRIRRLRALMDGTARRAVTGGKPEYELLLYGIQTLNDLVALVPWSTVRPNAKVWACYIDDLYVSRIAEIGWVLDILKRFDVIFVCYGGTAEPLAKATGRPCHYLPASVDTLTLCPFPYQPQRVIDFYAMGRRPPRTHEALTQLAERRGPSGAGWYYLYDTVGEAPVTNHLEHRRRLGEIIKRTRYFLVNPAMCNQPGKTAGQRELGYRFFEGAAGGAVLIGEHPNDDASRGVFGWRDSVIHLPFDSAEIEEAIRALDADPDRVDRIRRTNVVNSLRLNDHVYRWAELLRLVGLPETEAIEARRRRLNDLADQIERTGPINGPRQAESAPVSPGANGLSHTSSNGVPTRSAPVGKR